MVAVIAIGLIAIGLVATVAAVAALVYRSKLKATSAYAVALEAAVERVKSEAAAFSRTEVQKAANEVVVIKAYVRAHVADLEAAITKDEAAAKADVAAVVAKIKSIP